MMLKFGSFLVLVVGLVVASFCIEWSSCDEFETNVKICRPFELSDDELKAAEKLAIDLLVVDEHLQKKVPACKVAEEIIKAANELLKKTWFKRRSALNLFISLKSTVESCDFKSYKILARLFVALGGYCEDDSSRPTCLALDEYRKRHAKKCRPQYRRKFHELLTSFKMDQKSPEIAIERVQILFQHVNHQDLAYRVNEVWFKKLPQAIKTIADGDVSFGSKAYELVAKQLFNLMLEDKKWESFRPHSDDKGAKQMLDEYLFKSCKKYNNHFDAVLIPARFDAALRDEQQMAFLNEDQQFTKAIVNRLICKHLVENQEGVAEWLIYFMNELGKSPDAS